LELEGKRRMKKLKGFLQSGILFIGDPCFMAGDMSPPGAHEIVDPTNPFFNWDRFTETMEEDGVNLPFPNSSNEGRGVAVQTHKLSAQYEIIQEIDQLGNLKEIRIIFK
jgi:hypothetical protein